jgi:hypothetical protein
MLEAAPRQTAPGTSRGCGIALRTARFRLRTGRSHFETVRGVKRYRAKLRLIVRRESKALARRRQDDVDDPTVLPVRTERVYSRARLGIDRK